MKTGKFNQGYTYLLQPFPSIQHSVILSKKEFFGPIILASRSHQTGVNSQVGPGPREIRGSRPSLPPKKNNLIFNLTVISHRSGTISHRKGILTLLNTSYHLLHIKKFEALVVSNNFFCKPRPSRFLSYHLFFNKENFRSQSNSSMGRALALHVVSPV